jgi:hypothetical protein
MMNMNRNMNINNLENFMFSKKNLPKYYSIHSNFYNIRDEESKQCKQAIQAKENKINKPYTQNTMENKDEAKIISQENKLFWAFYVFLFSFEEYNILTNHFKIEQDFKIKSILKIRENKEALKLHKIKRNVVEDELLNEKKISLKSLDCLALIYKLNIVYIKDRTFFIMNYNNSKDLSSCKNIIEEKWVKGERQIRLINISKEILNKIFSEYYQIENLGKIINALSYYKQKDLLDICKKLNIDVGAEADTEINTIDNDNDIGNDIESEDHIQKIKPKIKTKTKKDLYTEICQVLNKV